MTRVLGSALALLVLVPACDGAVTDDTDAQECLITYKMFPEDEASRAYYRTTVDASFSEVVDGAALVLHEGSDTSGAAVDGSTAWDSTRLVFTPTTALTPGATYTAMVSFPCEGQDVTGDVTWTVSEVGAPTDAGGLVGNDYSLDLGSARFLRPDSVGDVIGEFLDTEILMSVKSVEGSTLTVYGALGDTENPGNQEQCSPTIDFPSANFSENPYFELGPQKFEITVSDVTVTIEDLFLAGSFSPDGSYIDGATLSGVVDTRPFAPLLEDDPDAPPEAVCEFTGRLNIPCIPCPDGSGDFCLEILADSIAATSEGVADVVEIPDICAIEACQSEPECQQGG